MQRDQRTAKNTTQPALDITNSFGYLKYLLVKDNSLHRYKESIIRSKTLLRPCSNVPSDRLHEFFRPFVTFRTRKAQKLS
jgi:hypothetical protein